MGLEAASGTPAPPAGQAFPIPRSRGSTGCGFAHSTSSFPDDEEGDMLRTTARVMALVIGWRIGADLEEARTIFEEAVALGERRGDPATLAIAYGTLGVAEGTSGGDVDRYVSLIEKGMAVRRQHRGSGRPGCVADRAHVPVSSSPRGTRRRSPRSTEVLEITDGDLGLGAGHRRRQPARLGDGLQGSDPDAAWQAARRRRMPWRRESGSVRPPTGRASAGPTPFRSTSPAADFSNGAPRPSLTAARRLRSPTSSATDSLGSSPTAWFGLAQLWDGQPQAALETLDSALATVSGRGVGLEYEPILARHPRPGAGGARGSGCGALRRGATRSEIGEQRGVRFIGALGRVDLAASLMERKGPEDISRSSGTARRGRGGGSCHTVASRPRSGTHAAGEAQDADGRGRARAGDASRGAGDLTEDRRHLR